MALSMKSYKVLCDHIDRIHKADANYAMHMWDDGKEEALNGFIDALADLATDVELSILEHEMPPEERCRQMRVQLNNNMAEEVDM